MNKLYTLIILISISLSSCGDDDDAFNPLEEGYVSYFSFDEHLNDANGYASTIENYDSLDFVAGKKEAAIHIGGENKSIRFDKHIFTGKKKISVSVWFKTSQISNTKHFIWCSGFSILPTEEKQGCPFPLITRIVQKVNSNWIHGLT